MYTGAIYTGGDLFSQNARDPRLSQLYCTGVEESIIECRSKTQDIGTCSVSMSYAVAVCQGKSCICLSHTNFTICRVHTIGVTVRVVTFFQISQQLLEIVNMVIYVW